MMQNERQREFAHKRKIVCEWLGKRKFGGVLLTARGLFSWAAAGAENHVTLTEDGAASLLITPKSVTVFADNIEMARLQKEEFFDLSGLEFFTFPWAVPDQAATELRRRVGRGVCVADDARWGTTKLPAEFTELTYALTDNEVVRYRKLGRDCSAAMEDALAAVRPGMLESQVAGLVAARMYDHKVTPHLVLVAADERIKSWRHPLPKNKRLRRNLMAVLCGRRAGLIISLTRMMRFGGELPADLRRRHDAAVAVDVAFNAGTRLGRPTGEIFREAMREYAAHGFPDEWKLHHQGGPTGYQGRSWKAHPDDERPVQARQAFAWNPSVTGTKSEDTVWVGPNGVEFLSTPSTMWPCLKIECAGRTWRRPDIRVV